MKGVMRPALATLVCGVPAGSIVVVSGTLQGTPAAMHAATDCFMPLGLLWWSCLFLAVVALSSGYRKVAIAFLIQFMVIGVIGNGQIAKWAMATVEMPRDPQTLAATDPFRCVILLGGSVSVAADGTFELNSDGQRVMLTAQLWHAGKTASIITTGTSIADLPDPRETGRQMLQSVGVPAAAIYEISGRNTFEEMQRLKQFVSNPPKTFPAEGRIALVTSAFHIPRAIRHAEQHGLDLVPLPCSHRVGKSTPFTPAELIPTAGHAQTLALASKEWLAWLVGR